MKTGIGRAGLIVACIGCVFFGFDLRALGETASVNATINSEQAEAQAYEVNDSNDNRVTFSDGGSISCSSENGAIIVEPAAGVELTPDNLLTLIFENDPSVGTDINDAADEKVLAHVYATNTKNNQTAIGVNLANVANLTIDAADKFGERGKYRPTIAARSNVAADNSVNGAAVGLQAGQANQASEKNTITFAVPVSIYGSSIANSSASERGAFAAAVIGAAAGFSNSSVSGITVKFLGDGNTLSANSSANSESVYSNSAATVLGAAVGDNGSNSAVTASNITATFGDGNTLSAISSASSLSVATVLGAAVGETYNTVTASEL
jgi:hypothetical protein